MSLSQEQLEQFERRGYVVIPGLISAAEVAELRTEVDGLHERMHADCPADVHISWEDASAQPRIRQLMNSEQVSPRIASISRLDRLLDALEQLMGPDIMLFHSKLMMKAAKDGSFTPWHQDWGYWRRHSRRPSQVNCMLAIDAADEVNGCIRFVPGSHQQGPVDHEQFDVSSFNIGLAGGLDAYEAELCVMRPGDAVLFGPLVIHGSGPNESDRHRRANTFAFDVPGNRTPELPPDRMRRGTYRGESVAGVYSDVR